MGEEVQNFKHLVDDESKTPDFIVDIRPEVEKELNLLGITIEGSHLYILSKDAGQKKATKKPFIYYYHRFAEMEYLQIRKLGVGQFEIERHFVKGTGKPEKYLIWKEDGRVKFKLEE